jgi:hypothetical protein
MTGCVCTEAGWCDRHKMLKSEHFLYLCQTQEDYWKVWEAGNGPGQSIPAAVRPIMPPGPGTELSKLLGCGGCSFAKKMNEWGCDKCLENIDVLIRLLGKRKKGRIPRRAARRMIEIAVKKARSYEDSLVLRSDISSGASGNSTPSHP